MFKYLIFSCLFFGFQFPLIAINTKHINNLELLLIHIIFSLITLILFVIFNFKKMYFKLKTLKRKSTLNKKNINLFTILSGIIVNLIIIYDLFVFSLFNKNTYLYMILKNCFTILLSAIVISKQLKKIINFKSLISILIVLIGINGLLRV